MDSSAISAITGALSDFSVGSLVDVIVPAVAIAAPLVIAWFAWRFISRKAAGALKKGKM